MPSPSPSLPLRKHSHCLSSSAGGRARGLCQRAGCLFESWMRAAVLLNPWLLEPQWGVWMGQIAASYTLPLLSVKQTKTRFLLEPGARQMAEVPHRGFPHQTSMLLALPGREGILLIYFFVVVLFSFADPQMCPALRTLFLLSMVPLAALQTSLERA